MFIFILPFQPVQNVTRAGTQKLSMYTPLIPIHKMILSKIFVQDTLIITMIKPNVFVILSMIFNSHGRTQLCAVTTAVFLHYLQHVHDYSHCPDVAHLTVRLVVDDLWRYT